MPPRPYTYVIWPKVTLEGIATAHSNSANSWFRSKNRTILVDVYCLYIHSDKSQHLPSNLLQFLLEFIEYLHEPFGLEILAVGEGLTLVKDQPDLIILLIPEHLK